MDAFNQTRGICFSSPQEAPIFTVMDPHPFRVPIFIVFTFTFMNYVSTRGPEYARRLFQHTKEAVTGIPITLLSIILQNQKERQWGVHY